MCRFPGIRFLVPFVLLVFFLAACSAKAESPKILDLDVNIQTDRYANQFTARVRVSNSNSLSKAPTIVFVVPAEVAAFVNGLDQVSEVLTRLPSGVRSSTSTDQAFAGIMMPVIDAPGLYYATLIIDAIFQPSRQTDLLSKIKTTAIVFDSSGKETDRRSTFLTPEMILRNAPPQEDVRIATKLVPTLEEQVVKIKPTAASPRELKMIDKGNLNRATTTGTLDSYTAHQYRYSKKPSGGYEYVAFALYRISGDIDPYLTVTVNGKAVYKNDNSYLADKNPGAARLPEDGYFCTQRGAKKPVIFDLIVRSANGKEQGEYKLSLDLINSRASADKCVQVFGDN